MCEHCVRQHQETMKVVNEEMDEQGVPEDSLLRGLADINIACRRHPILAALMLEMWPTTQTILEGPVDMTGFLQ